MVVAAILPISAFLLCFIHKVRGSRGCVNHSCVLVFALYKRYVVVAVVLNISAHSICFIQKVSGSRGRVYYPYPRFCFALYTRYVVVAAVVTIAAFYCALYKRYVHGSRVCITYVRVLYFVLYKTYRVSALTSYISATYHIFNTKGLHELQLYLRIAFPLYKNHPLTAVLLATFFSYNYFKISLHH